MSRLTALSLLALCALLAYGQERAHASARIAVPDPDRAPHDPPTHEERRRVRKTAPGGGERRLAGPAPEALPAGAPVDVERYSIAIRVIPPPTPRVEGTVRILARVVAGDLSTLAVDLYDAMAVTSIAAGAGPLSYTRGDNRIQIALDRVYHAGETIDLTIAYGGTPPPVSDGCPPR